jgi:radical SAM protein with 4Fe4S-binding SPASM domain
MGELLDVLRSPALPAPSPRQGDLAPAFLGMLPTRRCNLACRYCGFMAQAAPGRAMDLKLARHALEWYLRRAGETGRREAEIHYFGGEPFYAPEVLDFTVHYARIRAAEWGVTVRFEAATNGVFGEERAHWAADHLDTIVLSLDGPADVQDRHRPRRNGGGSFESVARNARILSEGAAQLFFRACVTAQTVDRLPEIARWFCDEYRPRGVCFEPVQPLPHARPAGLEPPDAWAFARSFIRAAWVLEACGVETVYAAGDVHARRVSFCPVGQDVVIVSPDGDLNACYLLEQDWQAKGMDLRLGRIEPDGRVALDPTRVAAARRLNVLNKPGCAHCFCKWHCAGGCHVNHTSPGAAGAYDRLCLQTRLISLRNLLKTMGFDDLTPALLADDRALERAARQPSDALMDVGAEL